MEPDQRFEIEITAPEPPDDRHTLDAEQIQRWLQEHRPHHSISVREVTA